ncbi:MAG: gfo/Idh/MocA family oxidoreductase, partial [Phycisphaerae bacterium]|nr:gfo/Idh/MocA family oxidoreductase [Phycisphaerae bacterium]
DGRMIEHFDFLTNTKKVIDTRASDASMSGGHGGGDYRLIAGFIAAVAASDQSKILSGPAETLETHLMVFAAEQARRENRVVEV